MNETGLRTERLNLRPFTLDDADFVLALLSEPSFREFIGDKGVKTMDDARRYIERGPLDSYVEHGYGAYVVETRKGAEPVGMCGLFKRDNLPLPDLGFAFLARHCGRGYAREASRCVLAYARHGLGIGRVAAIVDPGNRRSLALLDRLGFAYEAPYRMDGEDKDLACYAVDLEPAT